MKLKCIKNSNKCGNFYDITVGKYYEVIDVIENEPDALIKIINDKNREWRYFEKYFVSRKSMLRKEKLKKIENESSMYR
jgi:hypothetical protein